jgi:hypothetical protein
MATPTQLLGLLFLGCGGFDQPGRQVAVTVPSSAIGDVGIGVDRSASSTARAAQKGHQGGATGDIDSDPASEPDLGARRFSADSSGISRTR